MIFNPLKQTEQPAVPSDALQSTSAIHNDQAGICPKCKASMGNATLGNNDTVFYCEMCRVSAPMPDGPIGSGC